MVVQAAHHLLLVPEVSSAKDNFLNARWLTGECGRNQGALLWGSLSVVGRHTLQAWSLCSRDWGRFPEEPCPFHMLPFAVLGQSQHLGATPSFWGPHVCESCSSSQAEGKAARREYSTPGPGQPCPDAETQAGDQPLPTWLLC